MKRIASFTLLAAFAALWTATLWAQSSVPNLINFQGKLTDNLGNPVADGAHNFTFRIYDAAVAGALRWNEGPVALTTADGLFNHSLGSVTPFSQTLFQDYDDLYLEIEADGEIQLPRIRLISTPYTRVANNLEVRSTVNDTVVMRTIPGSHQLSTYGTDGKEQIRLWGGSWGELWLHDQDATNDRTVLLSANSSSGGSLSLTDDNATSTIFLHGGLTGDASADLPAGAINSVEMLDEPGAASATSVSIVTLDGSVQNLLTRSIAVPAAGYVLVIGSVVVQAAHTGSFLSYAHFGVSDASGSFPANQSGSVRFPGALPTGTYDATVTMHGLFSVPAGVSTFYLVGWEISGDLYAQDRQLSLVYIPTAYGTVTPTKPAAGGPETLDKANVQGVALTAADIAAERAEAEKFNAERIARELAEVQARMQKLEEQMRQNQQTVVSEP